MVFATRKYGFRVVFGDSEAELLSKIVFVTKRTQLGPKLFSLKPPGYTNRKDLEFRINHFFFNMDFHKILNKKSFRALLRVVLCFASAFRAIPRGDRRAFLGFAFFFVFDELFDGFLIF